MQKNLKIKDSLACSFWRAYVRLKRRFVYVAVLMDVFTRMIRGWQVSYHLNTSLTLKVLEQALHQSVPEIHHRDQGVQYLSSAYISTFTRHGIEISLAHRGSPWKNGYAERLIRILKEEEVHINDYEDITQASEKTHRAFYHTGVSPKTPHSALEYLTPVEFSQQNLD